MWEQKCSRTRKIGKIVLLLFIFIRKKHTEKQKKSKLTIFFSFFIKNNFLTFQHKHDIYMHGTTKKYVVIHFIHIQFFCIQFGFIFIRICAFFWWIFWEKVLQWSIEISLKIWGKILIWVENLWEDGKNNKKYEKIYKRN